MGGHLEMMCFCRWFLGRSLPGTGGHACGSKLPTRANDKCMKGVEFRDTPWEVSKEGLVEPSKPKQIVCGVGTGMDMLLVLHHDEILSLWLCLQILQAGMLHYLIMASRGLLSLIKERMKVINIILTSRLMHLELTCVFVLDWVTPLY